MPKDNSLTLDMLDPIMLVFGSKRRKPYIFRCPSTRLTATLSAVEPKWSRLVDALIATRRAIAFRWGVSSSRLRQGYLVLRRCST
ncbi:hypothetical protein [Nostoc sp. NIES-3756]|uniref:hypothetical protein n=1 Tax=Nostoc sp. NIES-3756 TaxID=1751286 RepID=UPI0014950E9B|nr:hypothetical protein [Nostoc sp. NIES-3756]